MKKSIFNTLIIIITLNICSAQTTGSFKDKRDGRVYKTVKIGEQVWMAENLAYKTAKGSWAYDNNEEYVKTYGRLYNWETAKNVCPDGWHLPSDVEWDILTNYLGGNDVAGNKLKAKSDLWKSEDLYNIYPCGFDALPGGCRYDFSGNFYDLGYYAYFWTSSPANGKNACRRYIFSNFESVNCFYYLSSTGYSVRCIKD